MKTKYYIFIAIVVLAFLVGNFAQPKYFNDTVDYLNKKFGWALPNFIDKPYVLGLDLQGGVNLTYEADLTSSNNPSEDMQILRDVIERRINMFGVSEPVVQIQGQNRLLVELPGVKDVNQAIQMIGETPYLEFLEQREEQDIQKILDKIEEVKLAQESGEDISKIIDWYLIFENPYFKPTELTGKYLKTAIVNFDNATFKPEIHLQFDDEGSRLFEQITERNIQKPIAIFLDNMSIIDTTGDNEIDGNDLYAPIVQDKISGGKAVITGNMNIQTANSIVSRLKSGALPVKIGEPVSQEVVGPTLGKMSLEKSLSAGIWGLLSVIVFMVIFYRLPGLLASIALLIYVAIVLSLFKLIPVTLSLSGIGGFILSIGMAVDANILIFARTKEEIKQGKNLNQALQEGFARAWPSIRDSNFNSLIVCAILFIFATSFVRGFALTLIIGIITSMFSAMFITKSLLQIFAIPKLEKLKWLL